MAVLQRPDANGVPADLDAEGAVLGALMIAGGNGRARQTWAIEKVRELIGPEDFFAPMHGQTYHAMLTLEGEGQPIDLITVGHRLTSDGYARPAPADLTLLLLDTPTCENIAHYGQIVREKSVARILLLGLSEGLGRLRKGEDPAGVFAFLSAAMTAADARLTHPPRTATRVIRDWAEATLQPTHRIGSTWRSAVLGRPITLLEFRQSATDLILNQLLACSEMIASGSIVPLRCAILYVRYSPFAYREILGSLPVEAGDAQPEMDTPADIVVRTALAGILHEIRPITVGDYSGYIRSSLVDWADKNAQPGAWIQVPGFDCFCQRNGPVVRLGLTYNLIHQVKCKELSQRFRAIEGFATFLEHLGIAQRLRVRVRGHKIRLLELLPGWDGDTDVPPSSPENDGNEDYTERATGGGSLAPETSDFGSEEAPF